MIQWTNVQWGDALNLLWFITQWTDVQWEDALNLLWFINQWTEVQWRDALHLVIFINQWTEVQWRDGQNLLWPAQLKVIEFTTTSDPNWGVLIGLSNAYQTHSGAPAVLNSIAVRRGACCHFRSHRLQRSLVESLLLFRSQQLKRSLGESLLLFRSQQLQRSLRESLLLFRSQQLKRSLIRVLATLPVTGAPEIT